MPDLIAGIDLGTTTSAIGYFSENEIQPIGSVRLVAGEFGRSWIYSALVLDVENGRWIVGTPARNMSLHPHRAPYYVVSAKRHLGIDRTLSLGEGGRRSDRAVVQGEEVELTPRYLLSIILTALKDRAEQQGPEFHMRDVVVAVPMVYMSDEASLTKEAVQLAGLEVLDLIQEPTAAALCFVHETPISLKEGEKILVFDLGGGTFDVTVFQLSRGGDELSLDVLATDGVRHLGGDDVDALLLEHLRGRGLRFKRRAPSYCERRLLQRIEETIKVPLSNAIDGEPPVYFDISDECADFDCEISRAEFLAALEASDVVAELRRVCERLRAQFATIERALLVGGSSSLPMCKPIIERVFPGITISTLPNAQEAVVRGAVYRAAQLKGRPTGNRRVTLRNSGVLSHDFGVIVKEEDGSESFIIIIPKNTPYPMPAAVRQSFPIVGDVSEPVVIECAQGDGAESFQRDASAHRVFASLNLGHMREGDEVTISYQANSFGEILFGASWPGGVQPPTPLRPLLGA